MATTCKRHPDQETRLFCANCSDPICPRCSVDTPVGQKCPACARQARSARARGKPRQYAKGIGAGLLAAAGVAVGLRFLIVGVGFLTWIASGFGGYGVARAVRWGAEGNAAGPFRIASHILAVGAVEATWLAIGFVVAPGLNIVTYIAAVYGVIVAFR
ncbi:MAG: B-box zinc finger protein [Nitriliruptorales bacterium]